MMRKSTLGGFHWSPFLYSLKEASSIPLNHKNKGAPLIFLKGNASIRIFNVNNGFRLEALDDESKLLLEAVVNAKIVKEDHTLKISQNAEGIDLEDRIDKGIEMISKIFTLEWA